MQPMHRYRSWIDNYLQGKGLRAQAFLVVVLAAALLLPGALLPAGALGQPLDLSGWQIKQHSSDQTFTIPAGTTIQPGGYLILARFASRAEFESFYGVTLGSDVIYLTNATSNPVVPMINGDETYELYNAGGGLEDGPTPAIDTIYRAYHRDDPESPPWTSIDTSPTPGSGVEPPDDVFSGMVISEANDPSGSGAYVYEFVELYFDNDGGGVNLDPVISDVQHTPAAPEAGGDVTVSATATDPDGTISEVLLWWRNGGGAFASLPMSTAGGDSYVATVVDLQGDRQLDYYVSAEDDDGAIAYDPVGAPTLYHSVWVAGEIPPGRVILFDHAHDQDAGSDGNWRVDDDFPYPQPADPTNEADWSGQLSAWAYELYLAGHTIRSNTALLDGSQLTDVDLLVIVEPQNPFTQAEIEAVGEFVHAGGSLFVVANHNGSDRNGNGWDSASIFGGYSEPHITTPPTGDVETFCGALFGLHFHVKDEGNNSITGTFSNVDSDPANPIIHGPAGDVAAVIYHVGNVMSLWPLANPDLTDVAGHIWKDGDTGNPDVNIAAWSRYGQGKVMGYGDSSSAADGTGSEPHENDWEEAGGNNREFFLNATAWLLTELTAVPGDGSQGDPLDGVTPLPGLGLRAAPNPFNPRTEIRFATPAAGRAEVEIFDLRGKLVRTLLQGEQAAGEHRVTWDGLDDSGSAVASGVYLVRAAAGASVAFTKAVLTR
jgi:hypothetical protein